MMNNSLRTDQRGMASLEIALGLSVIVLVVAIVAGALTALAAKVAAVDNAGAAARAHAIGMGFTPTQGHVNITESGGLVTATAQVPSMFGGITAHVVFPAEDVADEPQAQH